LKTLSPCFLVRQGATKIGHFAANQPFGNKASRFGKDARAFFSCATPHDGHPKDQGNGGDAPTPSSPHGNHMDREPAHFRSVIRRSAAFGAGTIGLRRSIDPPPRLSPGDFDDMDLRPFRMLSSGISYLHHGTRSTLSHGRQTPNQKFVVVHG
jgi:hypothetical protein